MAETYRKKKHRQSNILYTFITAFLICVVFLGMVANFYQNAADEAYEMLHIQTKQIKDDLVLQLKSDRENLVTMANFAAKLYDDGEDYDLMFRSFKPIGLFSNIGILNPDDTFYSWRGKLDLNGKISFEDEARRGEYISGRIKDLTLEDKEIIRSAVPIKVEDKIVGILYGVIHPATISAKYEQMAKDLDAQLFVYDKETGKFIINTADKTLGDISQLKYREYNDGYTYEQLVTTDNGYSSFKSKFTGEDLFLHYSTLEDFNWGIMLARYESQVFAETDKISGILLSAFGIMLLIIAGYLLFILNSEKKRTRATTMASGIRKLLLEVNKQYKNIVEALRNIQEFSSSRSAFFVDTDGEDYNYILPEFNKTLLRGEERTYFIGELFKCVASFNSISKVPVGMISIIPNNHLAKTNARLYNFLKEHDIREVSFSSITDKNNGISVIGVINPKNGSDAKILLGDIAVCFSIAIYNKKHLNKTEIAAATDSLTGVLNRVSYKKDIMLLDEEKPENLSCIYVDVNELHLRNNKYGHAAGDEMLIYIANTLRDVFFGHAVYRMGGDEFLVFVKNVEQANVKDNINIFVENLKATDYKVALGMSFRKQGKNCEELVREAEKRMYEAKAQYYQNKGQNVVLRDDEEKYIQTKTGIREIDTMLSILKEHYNGIYRVSLETDRAHRILMPSYLGYNETEDNFSQLLSKYIEDMVHPDFRRAIISFLNYDAVIRQILEGKTPAFTYKKVDGEEVTLRVYKLDTDKETVNETLWVFERK